MVVNPEVALDRKGAFEKLWHKKMFLDRVLCVVWDEAHCVSAWSGFREGYQHAERLRNSVKKTVPRHIPFLLPSAMLPTPVLNAVCGRLQVDQSKARLIHMSNDRPNIFLTVRKIRHSLSSYRDLTDLLVPANWQPGHRIPKFLVFFDSKREAIAAADALRARLPKEYRTKVVWFNSDSTPTFREAATEDLKRGGYYGLMCTDAFGMVSTFLVE